MLFKCIHAPFDSFSASNWAYIHHLPQLQPCQSYYHDYALRVYRRNPPRDLVIPPNSRCIHSLVAMFQNTVRTLDIPTVKFRVNVYIEQNTQCQISVRIDIARIVEMMPDETFNCRCIMIHPIYRSLH
jgi:hypothetical protein